MTEGLRVLVVEDTPAILDWMAAMLKKMGHEAILAPNGSTALALYREHLPDAVLMDVKMPGMSGYETVRQMRQISDVHVPIIFVSAMGEFGHIVQGIQAGGDDYLIKPVDYEVLQVKLQALHERLRMGRQLAEQNRMLLDYQATIEEERQLAAGFMRKLSNLDEINDPAVHYFLRPAENFSGDLIAVARTPSNVLHVLLADSRGHGLVSALAVMPVLNPFYAMTDKGFNIGDIAGEMNRKVRECMPIDHFIALVIASFDPEDGVMSVWNGGCPPVMLLDGQARELHRFKSNHLPLGILPSHEFDASTASRTCDVHSSQFLLCSDGAVDLLEPSSMAAGMASMLQLLRNLEPATRLPHLANRLEALAQKGGALDDIALMLVDCMTQPEYPGGYVPEPVANKETLLCPAPRCVNQPSAIPVPGSPREQVEWEVHLTFAARQLRSIDVLPLLLHIVNNLELGNKQQSGRLFLVLSELFNNSLDHGLLKLDSSLKQSQEGIELFFEERARRLAHLEQGEIDVHLRKIMMTGGQCIKVKLHDSGAGFDVAAVMRRIEIERNGEQRHGRGIALVRSMVSALHYSENGTSVEVCLAQETSA